MKQYFSTSRNTFLILPTSVGSGLINFCDYRVPSGRGQTDSSNLITLAAGDFKSESIEPESLADLGYAPGFMKDEPGNGCRLFVGQVPLELAIEVSDGELAIHQVRAVGLRP